MESESDSDWALPKHRLKREQDLDRYRLMEVHPEDSRALRACTAFTGDVLVVESELDAVVPHQVIVNYRDAFVSTRSSTFRVIPGADHGLSSDAWQRAYTTVLVTWLTEMVFGARAGDPQGVAEAPAAKAPEAIGEEVGANPFEPKVLPIFPV
jgi:hypothetical protein